jgi:hypothetical protein
VGALIDAYRADDLACVHAATATITALGGADRTVLAWSLALSLGVHAARWWQPAGQRSHSDRMETTPVEQANAVDER